MNNKNISDLLNDGMKNLNIVPETLYEGKKYTIVEFCDKYLQMSEADTIVFCKKYIGDFPAITVKPLILIEDASQSTFDRIRSGIQNFRKVGAQPTPAAKPNAMNVPAKMGNFFATDNSLVRNAPMIKVVDKAMKARFFVFPDLDLTQPGHMEILKSIMAEQQKEGETASLVDTGSGDRNMAMASKAVTTIGTVGDKNKRNDLNAALTDLAAFIQNAQKQIASNKMAVSPQQIGDIKQQVTDKLAKLDGISAAPTSDPTTVAADATKKMDNAEASTPGVPATGPTKPLEAPNGTQQPVGVAGTPINGTSTGTGLAGAYADALKPSTGVTQTEPEEQPLPITQTTTGLPATSNTVTGKEGLTVEAQPSSATTEQPLFNNEITSDSLLPSAQQKYTQNPAFKPPFSKRSESDFANPPMPPEQALQPNELGTDNAIFNNPQGNTPVVNPVTNQVKQVPPVTGLQGQKPVVNLQTPQVQQKGIIPTTPATAPAMPKPIVPQVPQFDPNQPHALIPEELGDLDMNDPKAVSAEDLARFSATQNASRTTPDMTTSEVPSLDQARVKSKADLGKWNSYMKTAQQNAGLRP